MSGQACNFSVCFPFANCKSKSAARIWLFCFPYAGESPSVFNTWPEHLDAAEVCAANLPGRGIRFHDEPFTQPAPLALRRGSLALGEPSCRVSGTLALSHFANSAPPSKPGNMIRSDSSHVTARDAAS